ncbi:MAG: ArnT family glycosyltransferase [Armatimonadota bacterium]
MLLRLGRMSIAWQRILLIVGCAVLFAVWLSWVPLTEIDEARFTEATREMLDTGDYLIPHFNGNPRYQKPILYYWIQAGSMRLFGVNETAARLPSAVATLLTVLLLHAFLLRWLVPRKSPDPDRVLAGRGAAFLGAAALAIMPLTAIWAHAAVTDPTLTLFITGAMLALLQADLDTGRARRWYLAATACMALAFLTKGPVGVALPAVVWIVYHLSRRSLRSTARAVPWIGSIAVFLVIAVPWYYAVYRLDPEYLKHFFLTENVERFTTVMEDHGFTNPILGLLFYPLVSLPLLFPISAFLLHDLIAPARQETMPLDAGVFPRLRRFAWCWIAGMLAVFSLSRTQLPHYIQPIAAAAAILFALHLLGRLHAPELPTRRRRWADAVMLFLLAFFGVLLAGGPAVVLRLGSVQGGPLGSLPFPPAAAQTVFLLLVIVGVLFIIGLVVGAARRRPLLLVGWIMAAWTGLLLVLILGLAPLAVRSQYGRSAAVGQYLATLPPGPVLFYTRQSSESVVFYARREINFFVHNRRRPRSRARFRAKLDASPQAVVVTDDQGLAELRSLVTVKELRAFGPCIVVSVKRDKAPK